MVSVGPLHTALSGLQANRKALAATANNVANVNTEDYAPIETEFRAEPGGGVTAHYERGETPPPGQSGVDLNQEAVNALIYRAGFNSNVKLLQRYDEMVGTLLDTVG